MVERIDINRRIFLRTSGAAFCGGVIAACTPNLGGEGENNGSVIIIEPRVTETPKPSPTPSNVELSQKNFDAIDRSENGQKIVLTNVVVHGFERVTVGIPGTNIKSSEDIAILARVGADGRTFISGYVMGADCLINYARQQDLLQNTTLSEGSYGDAKVQRWQFKEPLVFAEIEAESDLDIPGQEGGKILHLRSMRSPKSDIASRCERSSNIAVYTSIKALYLAHEKAIEERRKNGS